MLIISLKTSMNILHKTLPVVQCLLSGRVVEDLIWPDTCMLEAMSSGDKRTRVGGWMKQLLSACESLLMYGM